MSVARPPKIESGIPGIELCPVCERITTFVLPDINLQTGKIFGWSCPKCKCEDHKVKEKTGQDLNN
jgi:hypothetical protein